MIDASPVVALGTNEVPNLQSACTRMVMCGLSEVAKALCRGIGTCMKSQGRPVWFCARWALGAGGGIGCALPGKKWNQQLSKRKQRLTFKKGSFQFFLVFTYISSLRIGNKSSTSLTSLLGKMIYLADHRRGKDSVEYSESVLWLYVFGDRIISSAKPVHICWITDLYRSAPNLSHSSVYFRSKQPKLVKK